MENRMPEEDSEGADIAPVNAALRTVEARPKVLLVEDDPTIVEVTRLFLSDIIDMDIACEGETALKMANENNYKAILMDINLGKGLSGLDVTKILRGSEKYKDTPIVAFTAFALDGDEKSFLNEGCTHYIPKPFSKKKLLDLVKSII
jgi:CheY-like chemotaxis protein